MLRKFIDPMIWATVFTWLWLLLGLCLLAGYLCLAIPPVDLEANFGSILWNWYQGFPFAVFDHSDTLIEKKVLFLSASLWKDVLFWGSPIAVLLCLNSWLPVITSKFSLKSLFGLVTLWGLGLGWGWGWRQQTQYRFTGYETAILGVEPYTSRVLAVNLLAILAYGSLAIVIFQVFLDWRGRRRADFRRLRWLSLLAFPATALFVFSLSSPADDLVPAALRIFAVNLATVALTLGSPIVWQIHRLVVLHCLRSFRKQQQAAIPGSERP